MQSHKFPVYTLYTVYTIPNIYIQEQSFLMLPMTMQHSPIEVNGAFHLIRLFSLREVPINKIFAESAGYRYDKIYSLR